MVFCLIFGLAWIAVFYVSSGGLPVMSAFGNWNLLVGFSFIIGGVALSTRWR